MSKRESEYLTAGSILLGLAIFVFGLTIGPGYYSVKKATTEAEARVQVAHEINLGLTNFGQMWNNSGNE